MIGLQSLLKQALGARIMRALRTALVGMLLAANVHAQSGGEANAIFDQMAALPSMRAADIEPMLLKLGFRHDMPDQDWHALAPRTQLEIAYRSAEAAETGNGKRFIAAFARLVENRYESLRFNPVFMTMFGGDPPPDGPVRFARPTPAQIKAPLPSGVATMLDGLSVYVEGPGRLGRVAVLRNHFNLRSPQLEEALRERDTTRMLRRAAALAAIPPEVLERAHKLAAEIRRYYDSAVADPAVRKVLTELDSRVPPKLPPQDPSALALDPRSGDIGPSGGGGGGGGGGSPARVNNAARAHADFDRVHYSTPQARQYRVVRARAGGRGGVIAGASVSAPGIGKPVRISIDAPAGGCDAIDGTRTRVTLVVHTADGRRLRYPNVACDTLIAAKGLVYDRHGDVQAWTRNEAIGLASIDIGGRDTFPLYIPSNLDVEKIGRRHKMLLHPALVDLDIGQSITRLDLWPSARLALLERTDNQRAVAAFLDALRRLEATTWKWSDSDAVISANADVLSVSGTKAKSLLSFRAFDGLDGLREREGFQEALQQCRGLSNPDEQTAALCKAVLSAGARKESGRDLPEFAAALPVFVRRIPDFGRADELLRVLAVIRWARAEGATIEGPLPNIAGGRPLTPDTLIIALNESWIATAPEAQSYRSECETFFARFEKAKARVSATSGFDRAQADFVFKVLENGRYKQAIEKGRAGCVR